MLQVSLSHAVGDPMAVVVHAEDAPTTFATVMGSRRLHTIADGAKVHEFFLEVRYLIIRKYHHL